MRRALRLLHTSQRTYNLVGPPDPVSNFRPVLYTDTSTSPTLRHPYSLSEFAGDHDLQWRLQRQSLDAFNHNFWTDASSLFLYHHEYMLSPLFQSNTRFEAAKQSVLSSLPQSSTPLARERALSEFYRKWVMQESHRQALYTAEWRRRNLDAIVFAVRVALRNLQVLIGDFY